MKNMTHIVRLLAFLLILPVVAHAEEMFDRNALPHDKAALAQVHEEHVLKLRQAVRICEDFSRSRHDGNICVVSTLDQEIRNSDNEALKAFHWTLTSGNRYDDKRSMVEVLRQIGLD